MARVFLCDDESHYRSLVRAVLSGQENEAYEVVGEASDGREAIERAPALEPDILLLDVNMPGMGGLEALPKLRELLPDTKILALTTAWAEPWEQRFLAAGGDGFIEKPRNAMTLPAKLRAALGVNPVDPLDVAELMFHTWWSDDRERTWEVFAPDVEYRPIRSPQVFHGIEAMRDYIESMSEEERRTTVTATRMTGLDDRVVIEGTAEAPRGDAVDRYPVAWTVRVAGGRIVSVVGHKDAETAREDAGLRAGVQPTAEREFGRGHGWLLAAARRLLGAPAPRPAVA